MCCDQDRTTARDANLYLALILHWNNWKYAVIELRIKHGKEFLLKLSAVGTRALKIFATPILRRKIHLK
jgi:hypothetical protein